MTETRAVIVSAVRTPIGTFGGALKDLDAVDLGAMAIREALVRCAVNASDLDEVLMGQVYAAGCGMNPARIAAMKAAVPCEVPATTVNQVCGSSLKCVALAAQAVASGAARIVLAGGMESMSRTPYLLPNARWGERMGHGRLVDVLLRDGLWDAFCDCHMGRTAEHLAEQYGISREAQDRYACLSQTRCQEARRGGLFDGQIVPVAVPQRKGEPLGFSADEHPREGVTVESLGRLKPAFQPDGTVTAGNASGICDGAAALVVMSEAAAAERGLRPMAVIRGLANVGVEPMRMGIAPALAIRKLLAEANLALGRIDLLEVNEAFAAQTLAVGRELDWDEARVNVNGGAIALGHPLGASGARITVTLLHEMRRRDCRLGIAALCIGGGMGIAALLERPGE
jgi:acetyl-CoA C-acetyltransferase